MTIAVNHCDRVVLPSSADGAGAWPRPATGAVLTWLLLFAAELVASLALCDFRLNFSLDDAYIHLAVADLDSVRRVWRQRRRIFFAQFVDHPGRISWR